MNPQRYALLRGMGALLVAFPWRVPFFPHAASFVACCMLHPDLCGTRTLLLAACTPQFARSCVLCMPHTHCRVPSAACCLLLPSRQSLYAALGLWL
jgi:hypothetical protein